MLAREKHNRMTLNVKVNACLTTREQTLVTNECIRIPRYLNSSHDKK